MRGKLTVSRGIFKNCQISLIAGSVETRHEEPPHESVPTSRVGPFSMVRQDKESTSDSFPPKESLARRFRLAPY